MASIIQRFKTVTLDGEDISRKVINVVITTAGPSGGFIPTVTIELVPASVEIDKDGNITVTTLNA